MIPVASVAGIFFSLRSKDPLRGIPSKTFENQSASGVLYFLYPSRSLKRASFACGHKKNQRKTLVLRCLCGERGIRTPGTSRYAGFQDQCIRPLCHLSDRKPKLPEWAANLNRILWFARGFDELYLGYDEN